MGKRPADEDAGECVGELLDQALDLTARFLSDRADLSASAAFALNRVCREGPIRLTALAAKEGVSQPSMTQLIQRLERLGLVARLADPDDGRAALIGITGHGQALLDDRKRIASGTPDGVVGNAHAGGGVRVVALSAGRAPGPPSACRECGLSPRRARPRTVEADPADRRKVFG